MRTVPKIVWRSGVRMMSLIVFAVALCSLFTGCYLLPEEEEHLRIETEEKRVFGREKNDEIIGEVKIYLINRLLFSRNLYKL